MIQAKRIILRLAEDDMDYRDPYQFVRLYFRKLHSDLSPDLTRHCIHLQPPSDMPQSNTKVHIVIDLEVKDFSGPLNRDFPHEIYAVRRRDDDM
ncbi:hypothetical protein PHISCL_06984 [Aspergillus sclerotialis]|uniref:Uncharacterized protein n=1 Tax=Aspergillus sclerotialis TaxID=2070753 RepID=A0A3A2ZRT4_9EURO|nr:hypothetical protein PHISCL_06984 [Aspergillus sclerotialis]